MIPNVFESTTSHPLAPGSVTILSPGRAAAVDPDVPGGAGLVASHVGSGGDAGYGAMPFFRSSSMA